MTYRVNLSVHDIVDVLLRKGHLDTRIFNQSSMQEGTRLHALYQNEQGADYISEYEMRYIFPCDEYLFCVTGKADGILIAKDGSLTVEEIKTTVADLDEFYQDHGEWHLAQALFYAFMLAKEKNRSSVNVRLTYLRQGNYHIRKHIDKTYSFAELDAYTSSLILRYVQYMKEVRQFKVERDESCKDLPFPFKEYRKGQKEIVDFVEKAADEKTNVYLEAPTGIGKTISTLYPLVRRFGSHQADLVFYLTSKNSIKSIAMNALSLFIQEGAKAKAIELTAQEAICFNDRIGHCNPDECPFARNYYDKLLNAIFDFLHEESLFDRKTITAYCLKHQLCPFQFQLDLAMHCDVLVCDYTYVFDFHDRLCLEEDALNGKRAYLLVDECHNLPDRVRDMYSTEVTKSQFAEALTYCGNHIFDPLRQNIQSAISAIEHLSFDLEDEEVKNEGVSLLSKLSDDLLSSLGSILTDVKEVLRKQPSLISDPLLEFFYAINTFAYLAGLLSDETLGSTFLCYLRIEKEAIVSIRIANLDAKPIIRSAVENFQSTCFFSATLSPKEYYIDLLGGDVHDKDSLLVLPSPFPKENRKVFVDTSLSLRYKDRRLTLSKVYQEIKAALQSKVGNYFVFCPSFQYLENLRYLFENDEEGLDLDLYVQERSMREADREVFLSHFRSENERTTLGLVVLGGVFSEGIDLIGDRLIGAIIVSIGLPQIGFERNRLKEYYDQDEEEKKGFAYAYAYPGINKVLQASGRVIRSEEDRGFILFIDSRYRQGLYQEIFAELYPDCLRLVSLSQLKTQLRLFWKENHDGF